MGLTPQKIWASPCALNAAYTNRKVNFAMLYRLPQLPIRSTAPIGSIGSMTTLGWFPIVNSVKTMEAAAPIRYITKHCTIACTTGSPSGSSSSRTMHRSDLPRRKCTRQLPNCNTTFRTLSTFRPRNWPAGESPSMRLPLVSSKRK